MLNLLNKYGELHKSFEGVGRYYKNEFLPLVL